MSNEPNKPVKDRDYWARVHIEGDKRPPLNREDRPRRRRFLLGSGVRVERGGKSDWTQ